MDTLNAMGLLMGFQVVKPLRIVGDLANHIENLSKM